MDSLFIADGHHRSAAALRVKKELSKKILIILVMKTIITSLPLPFHTQK